MSFLEAAFLAGALAVGIPFLLHLLDRRRAVPVAFPSLRFLREVERRTARRRRLVEWLVLALRAAALLLLALGLSRPVLRGGSQGGGQASRVLVVDNSMSSRVEAGGLSALERYRSIAQRILGRMEPGDRGVVLPLHGGGGPRALTESRRDLERAGSSIEATYRATPLAARVEEALDLLREDRNPLRELYVLSDLQRSALEVAAPFAVPAGVRVVVLRPRLPRGVNAAWSSLEVLETGGRPQVRASLRASGEGEAVVRLTVELDGRRLEERSLRLAAGSEPAVRFRLPELPPGLHHGRVRIEGDLLASDNTWSFAFRSGAPVRVLLVRDRAAGAGSSDPAYYLARALAAPAGAALEIESAVAEDLDATDLSGLDVLFLLGCRKVSERSGAGIARFVRAGGGLFIAVGPLQDSGSLESIAAGGVPVAPAALGPAVRARTAPFHLARWREEHPLWEPLLRATPPLDRRAPLFLAYRKVEPAPGAEVLASFDTGDPALLARSSGSGEVLLFASTLAADWGNLPLRFLFAPFVHRALELLAARGTPPEEHVVGVPLLLRYAPEGAPREVTTAGPGEAERRLRPVATPRGTSAGPRGGREGYAGRSVVFDLGVPEEPGHLVVTEHRAGRRAERFLVLRPELAESDLRPLEPGDLERLLPGARLVTFTTEPEALRQVARLEGGLELRSPFLLLALLLLGVEPLLANRSARKGRPAAERPREAVP